MVSYIATKPNAAIKTVTVHSTKNLKGIDFAFARLEDVSTGEQLVAEAFPAELIL